MSLTTARRLLWITAAGSLGLWALLFYWLQLSGNYMHVFLVAAIAIALMNLIAHYWTLPDADDRA
ncbi:MAG: hypothetical protein ACRD0Y_12975 [Terriglobales bacterium]